MTNFEYIVSRLTPRDLAILATHSSYHNIMYGCKEAATGSILDGSVHNAYVRFIRSFDDAYHKGNTYKEGSGKHPNVFEFENVYVDGEWIKYGHGCMLSFQIWLELPFNENDWSQ